MLDSRLKGNGKKQKGDESLVELSLLTLNGFNEIPFEILTSFNFAVSGCFQKGFSLSIFNI